MNLHARRGLARGRGEDELQAAEQLLETCNRHEGLDLPIALQVESQGGKSMD